jgi:large subunit ribosomal protein L40e
MTELDSIIYNNYKFSSNALLNFVNPFGIEKIKKVIYLNTRKESLTINELYNNILNYSKIKMTNITELLTKSTLNNELKFTIHISDLKGKILNFECSSSYKIYDIMLLLSINESIPINQQSLIYNGKQLEKNKNLSDYDIKDNAKLHLVLKLCGGMYTIGCGMNNLIESKFIFKIPINIDNISLSIDLSEIDTYETMRERIIEFIINNIDDNIEKFLNILIKNEPVFVLNYKNNLNDTIEEVLNPNLNILKYINEIDKNAYKNGKINNNYRILL